MKTEALKIFEDIRAKEMLKFDKTHKHIDSRNSMNPKQYQYTYTTHTKHLIIKLHMSETKS